jgi:biopolymer transport protein ExbD
MKFRRRGEPNVLGFQIAPIVDVLLVLLCFFILTWSFARQELELSVRVPSAENGEAQVLEVNQTVVNVRSDGGIVMNAKEISLEDFREKVTALAKLNPDYSIILRGDENAPYKHIARILDVCHGAGIWNYALPVSKPE